MVLQDETESFWCFVGLMKRMVSCLNQGKEGGREGGRMEAEKEGLDGGREGGWREGEREREREGRKEGGGKGRTLSCSLPSFLSPLFPQSLTHSLFFFSAIKEWIFRDLTLSVPLNSLARLCWYADESLYQHICEWGI